MGCPIHNKGEQIDEEDVITAFTAYAKFVSPETKLQRYSDTIAGIHRVLLDWRTRTDVEQANVANISELVGDCESLFSAERQAWVSTAMNNTALKDATGDLARVSLHAAGLQGEQFVQISGDDPSALGYCAMGGKGCISVTANIAPEQMAKMHKAVQEGDLATAQEIERKFIALHKALFVTPSPGPAKYALAKLGLCSGEVRLPIVAPHDAACEKIDAAMEIAGLI